MVRPRRQNRGKAGNAVAPTGGRGLCARSCAQGSKHILFVGQQQRCAHLGSSLQAATPQRAAGLRGGAGRLDGRRKARRTGPAGSVSCPSRPARCPASPGALAIIGCSVVVAGAIARRCDADFQGAVSVRPVAGLRKRISREALKIGVEEGRVTDAATAPYFLRFSAGGRAYIRPGTERMRPPPLPIIRAGYGSAPAYRPGDGDSVASAAPTRPPRMTERSIRWHARRDRLSVVYSFWSSDR